MPYIIAEPCVNVKDGACIDVCPVDCIYTRAEDNMMYIHPDECIDCAACEPVCPVTAIFVAEQTPPQWQQYIAMNSAYFPGKDLAALKQSTQAAPRKVNEPHS
jgi:ferredoxin